LKSRISAFQGAIWLGETRLPGRHEAAGIQ
jgi:hypothetical protein